MTIRPLAPLSDEDWSSILYESLSADIGLLLWVSDPEAAEGIIKRIRRADPFLSHVQIRHLANNFMAVGTNLPASRVRNLRTQHLTVKEPKRQ